jgi:hypothetical protein
MKTFLLSAFLVAASFTTSFAQSQASVATDSWADTPAAIEETPQYNMGWSTAPGQPLSLHGKPTTDYWGRPLKKKSKNLTTVAATREAAYADEESTDPMMRSSGVMAAPGMSSSPYRKPSTDYWGRPLKKKTTSTVATKTSKANSVAANSSTSW